MSVYERIAQMPRTSPAVPWGNTRCIYCGYRCYGRCCPAHRDLPQLEMSLEPQTTEPAAAPRQRPRRAPTKGA